MMKTTTFNLLVLTVLLVPNVLNAQEIQNFETNTDYYSCGLRRVSQNGLVGFENKKGAVVIPCQFNYAQPFLKKKCLAKKGAAMAESSATDSGETNYVWQGGAWGVVDTKGNILKPFDYQRKWNADMGEYIYVSKQDSFYINTKGKILELK